LHIESTDAPASFGGSVSWLVCGEIRWFPKKRVLFFTKSCCRHSLAICAKHGPRCSQFRHLLQASVNDAYFLICYESPANLSSFNAQYFGWHPQYIVFPFGAI